MDPFKVICVTCQAKLSVRNEALIGQIVGCPRCGSMVEIARPAAASAAAAAVTSSPESTINITARQIDQINEEVSQAAATPAESAPAAEPATSAADPAEAAETVPVEVLQATAEVAKYKIITWSLASFVIGATLVGAILYKGKAPTEEEPVAAVTETITAADPSPETDPISIVDEPEPPEPSVETELPTPDEPQPSTTAAELSVEPPAAEDFASSQEPPQPLDEPEPIEPPTLENDTDDSPTLTVEPAETAVPRFNPLQFDLASLSLAKLDQAPEPETQAVDPPVEDVPDEPVAVDPIDEASPAAPTVARLGRPDKKAPVVRGAEDQLKLMVPAIEFTNMPLLDALDLVSQLSGQPVSVAPEQLLMAGITSQKPVSLKADDISLREVLDKLLTPLRLEYTTEGPQIVVRRQDANKLREIKYPVSDLVSKEVTAEQLASWIEKLIAPKTWKSAGGNGMLESTADSLQVTQPQQVQYQVLILLERLRLARNLPPKSRYPVSSLVGAPANELLAAQLAAETTFTFTQLTPLAEVFAHWQTELGAPLLIDWPAMAEANVYPATPIACAVAGEPWHVALEEVLAPVGFGWRAVTGGAVEITLAERASNDLQVELLNVQSLDTSMLDRLRTLADQHGTNDLAALAYDPVGKVVLASQPATAMRAIYQHLREENLLDAR